VGDASRSDGTAASALNAMAADATMERSADPNGLTEGRNSQDMQQSTELSGTPRRPEEPSSSGENNRIMQPSQSIARNEDTIANGTRCSDENVNDHDTQGGR
jgi:hypothetical protein